MHLNFVIFYRSYLFFQMLISLEDQIVVLDEAHNIEDVSRSATSLDVTDVQLQKVKDELMGLLNFSSAIHYYSMGSCNFEFL